MIAVHAFDQSISAQSLNYAKVGHPTAHLAHSRNLQKSE